MYIKNWHHKLANDFIGNKGKILEENENYTTFTHDDYPGLELAFFHHENYPAAKIRDIDTRDTYMITQGVSNDGKVPKVPKIVFTPHKGKEIILREIWDDSLVKKTEKQKKIDELIIELNKKLQPKPLNKRQ